MENPNIRAAHAEEAAELTDIAFAAKQHWGYPREWMQLWRESLSVSGDYIAQHEVHVAETGGRIVGFHAIVPAGPSWELDHLWVRPDCSGRGWGRMLFSHAIERLRAFGPTTLGIESDPNSEGFYVKMGAKHVGERVRSWQGVRRSLPYLEFVIT